MMEGNKTKVEVIKILGVIYYINEPKMIKSFTNLAPIYQLADETTNLS